MLPMSLCSPDAPEQLVGPFIALIPCLVATACPCTIDITRSNYLNGAKYHQAIHQGFWSICTVIQYIFSGSRAFDITCMLSLVFKYLCGSIAAFDSQALIVRLLSDSLIVGSDIWPIAKMPLLHLPATLPRQCLLAHACLSQTPNSTPTHASCNFLIEPSMCLTVAFNALSPSLGAPAMSLVHTTCYLGQHSMCIRYITICIPIMLTIFLM